MSIKADDSNMLFVLKTCPLIITFFSLSNDSQMTAVDVLLFVSTGRYILICLQYVSRHIHITGLLPHGCRWRGRW